MQEKIWGNNLNYTKNLQFGQTEKHNIIAGLKSNFYLITDILLRIHFQDYFRGVHIA